MQAAEFDEFREGIGQDSAAETKPQPAAGPMQSRDFCAYNQTRECFLGLEIAEADIRYARLDDLIAGLTFKSGQGLWIAPFLGMPSTGVAVPIDLVYLDRDCKVVELIESFITSRPAPEHARAVSVLALPLHTIYSSQTQRGDQLAICRAGEMERRLERLSDNGAQTATVQSAAMLREIPLWSGGPGLLELERRSQREASATIPPMREMHLAEPGKREFRPPKNWLERWWSPDPRKAPREIDPRMAAYYWTGARPVAHSIRDISSTGLYVVTEERWYPGTLVLMTLQKKDSVETAAEHSILVHSRAVRWGNDGMGLQFIVADSWNPAIDGGRPVSAVSRKALDRFLRQISSRKE